jgi:hypothetical protein
VRFGAIVTSTLIALSVPTVTLMPAFTLSAQARSNDIAPTYYGNSDWSVTVARSRGNYSYTGINQQTGKSITLYGCQVSRSYDRVVYRWRNKGTVYQISWRPSDPDFARLQVYSPGGRELVNTLLTRNFGE